jgi:hypothetical protein
MSKEFWQLDELVEETGILRSTLERWRKEGIFEMLGTTIKTADRHNRQRIIEYVRSGQGPRILRTFGLTFESLIPGHIVELDVDTIPRPWTVYCDWAKAFTVAAVVTNGYVYAFPETLDNQLPDLPRRDIANLVFGRGDLRRRRQRKVAQK